MKITLVSILGALMASPALAVPATSSWPLSPLQKRFEPVCFPVQRSAHVDAAYACRDMLNARGLRGEICEAAGNFVSTTFCDHRVPEKGRAIVRGMANYPRYRAASNCADVARALDWMIKNCVSNNPCACGRTGQNAAWGNGDLIITLVGNDD